jgi:hypothetical protein
MRVGATVCSRAGMVREPSQLAHRAPRTSFVMILMNSGIKCVHCDEGMGSRVVFCRCSTL